MATEFKLPEVGEGIEAGTVVAVLVSVGDTIEVDQPVLELETDKAVVEVPSSVTGVVEKIHVEANQEARIGQVVLTVAEGGAAGKGAEGAAQEPGEEPAGKPAEEPAAEGGAEGGAEADVERMQGSEAPARTGGPAEEQGTTAAQQAPRPYEGGTGEEGRLIPAAPSVRRLARELDVDLREIRGSGILGRISADDVRRYAETGSVGAPTGAPAGAPAAGAARPGVDLPDFSKWGATERVAMSGIRKATVRSMTTAWANVPMVTHFDKADITEFEALRKRYKPAAEAIGAKLTPTAMLIKVVAAALRKFPDFNASIDVDAQEIVYKRYVNIGVAVDTDNGLLVPVIKDADRKNVLELAAELGELADKARARKLAPEDMQGGNFSVSNLGGIGGHGFTPIVTPPDVAILGVSRGGFEPVYDPDTGGFVPRMMMPLCVTYDHRLIDGAQAARFLRWICRAIEEPFLMSLEG